MGKPTPTTFNGDVELEHLQSLLTNTNSLPPVICVPGVGGSQLSAILNKTKVDRWYCDPLKNENWYSIWLALAELVPGEMIECWSESFVLHYNSTTKQFTNSSGVEIKPDYFGSTLGFEYLDPSLKLATEYFARLVNAFLKLGYVRGQNLLGAPYDWRLSPTYLPNYFVDFQDMIENAYAQNETKVAIIAHSLGNLFVLSFFQTVTQEWKDKYILTYVASSPPLVGAFTAVQSLTSGYNFGIPYLEPATAKLVQRTFPSTYFLLPYPKYYGTQMLVSTPQRNYTSMDYEQLLTDLGISEMYDPYTLSLDTVDPYVPPGVDTYCLYGYNVSTVIQESYSTNTFVKPTLHHGNGDGTVPVESLTFCKTWAGQTSQKLVVKGYKGQDHVGLLSYHPFIEDVISYIFNNTN